MPRVGWGRWDSCDPSLTSQIPTRTLTVTCPWKTTRAAPMLLPTHQTARRRRRPPSLASRAGTACWGLEPRECPFTVPPRVGQHQGCSHWGATEGSEARASWKIELGWWLSQLSSLSGTIGFLSLTDGGPGSGKVPWPGDFGTTTKESSGSGPLEERPRENGDALTREGSLGPLPGPSTQPHKGEWSLFILLQSPILLSELLGRPDLMIPTPCTQASSRRSVCPPSAKRAAS